MTPFDQMPFDLELVEAIEPYRLTMVIADAGLYTRNSQIRWAVRGQELPLIVSPQSMHRWIRRDVGESTPIRLITPQLLQHRTPDRADRTFVEMVNFGGHIRTLIERIARSNDRLTVRILTTSRTLEVATWLRGLGFTEIHYRIEPNKLTTSIRVLT